MEGPALDKFPPPCAPEAELQDSEVLLNIVQNEVDRQRSVPNCNPKEAQRVKNFVLFVLAIDYGVANNTSLSSEAREHFAYVYTCENDVRSLIKLLNDEMKTQRTQLASWLAINLYRPCLMVGLPVGYVLELINWFFFFTKEGCIYEGSVHRIARYHGMTRLAQKIYLDKTIIIPCVIPAARMELREAMLDRLESLSKQYFESVTGIRASSTVDSIRPKIFAEYKLNEDGRQVDAARKSAEAESEKPQNQPAGWVARIKTFVSRTWSKASGAPEKQVEKHVGLGKAKAGGKQAAPKSVAGKGKQNASKGTKKSSSMDWYLPVLVSQSMWTQT